VDVIKFVLLIYSWVGVGVLLLFLGRIAYFYEKTSGQITGYQFLVLPVLLLAGGVIVYLRYGREFTGYAAGDLLLFSGGALLVFLGLRLQDFMTGERR